MRFPPRDRARAALILLLWLLIVPSMVPSIAAADTMDRARLAPLAGSERLRMFTLGQAMAPGASRAASRGAAGAMRGALERAGFYHEGGPAVIERSLRASPVLAWEDNINGGYYHDSYDLFGLSFDVSPAHVAQSGLVAGGRVDGAMRLSWGEGRVIDLSAGVEAAWSPRHDIGRASASLQACARNHVTGWTFADLCASASGGRRALSSGHSVAVSAGLAHLFAAGESAHQLSLELEQRQSDGGAQTGLTLGWSAVWNRAVTQLSVGFATPIEGASATRLRVSARAGWMWQDRPVSVSLWHLESSGGMLLGVPREDRLTGIGLSVQARPGMSVEVSHQVNRSTLALFDEARTGVSLRLDLGRR